MKILLTGATGFVGTALRRELRSQGHDVRAFVRPKSAARIGRDEGCEIATGDILDSHACLRAVTGCDVLINLVGIRREYPRQGITYEALHTEATFNIADAARRAGVPRVIQMSALGTREGAPSRYHQTKWESEQIVRGTGMRWTIFRPSVIFGEGDEFHPTLADLVHRPLVPIIDGGKALLQPVSIANVVSAMAASVTKPESQGREFEVGGPERVAFIDLVHAVARHYEVWPNMFKASSKLMKPVVKFMQRFPSFPLTVDEMLMLLEDNVCDTEEFTRTFGVKLDPYMEVMPKLLEKVPLAA